MKLILRYVPALLLFCSIEFMFGQDIDFFDDFKSSLDKDLQADLGKLTEARALASRAAARKHSNDG